MRVLIVSRTVTPLTGGVVIDETITDYNYLQVVAPLSPLFGAQFDLIVLPEDIGDTGERYQEWTSAVVQCRLVPGGRMIYT